MLNFHRNYTQALETPLENLKVVHQIIHLYITINKPMQQLIHKIYQMSIILFRNFSCKHADTQIRSNPDSDSNEELGNISLHNNTNFCNLRFMHVYGYLRESIKHHNREIHKTWNRSEEISKS